VALLDWFRSTGAFTLASTHLLALKIYGANTGGVLNASMGFNDATLEPTFVLRTGAPGKSAGIEIAERLGLPEKLIGAAKSNLTGAERDIARFLAELHAKLDATATLEGELQAREARLRAREESLKVEWDKKESAKIRELERKFEQTLEQFRAQAEETIDAVKRTTEQKKAAEQARAKTSKVRREFAEQVGAILRPETGVPGALKVAEGARVRLKGIREIARVRRMVGEDAIEVEAGWMKIQVPRSDVVEVLPEAGGGPKLPKGVTVEMGPSWTLSEREINVIGKHAEEACDEVERFIDKASRASVDRVRVVHGHGMGILKRAIGELLKKNPLVEKFYPGSPGEGGTGATIVELKG
jgi:DNA mismatch repair protein MutS2